ncbi:hypothetical protein VPEG_00028 [Vibrio phage SIO-2]|uniref:hypothetical protein n=1 Tax=Vibrio phage SIO-2 TaxID=700512 RepID=UPI0002357C42|nr:hypothetical protein VPEG_00028 [Vibrio phage SIO-2]AET42179.1 hypothetical protein VPEG_00028 [Vibrio phage SIO-2]
MTPKQHIEQRLNGMTSDQLFDLMRTLNNQDSAASITLLEMATDKYMSLVPDATFLQAMEILDRELQY